MTHGDTGGLCLSSLGCGMQTGSSTPPSHQPPRTQTINFGFLVVTAPSVADIGPRARPRRPTTTWRRLDSLFWIHYSLAWHGSSLINAGPMTCAHTRRQIERNRFSVPSGPRDGAATSDKDSDSKLLGTVPPPRLLTSCS